MLTEIEGSLRNLWGQSPRFDRRLRYRKQRVCFVGVIVGFRFFELIVRRDRGDRSKERWDEEE